MTQNDNLITERLAKVRELLDAWEVDAIYVNSPTNRRWLSGFTGSSAWLLVSADQAWLATDFRYWEQARVQSPQFSLFQLTHDNPVERLLESAGVARVAVEAQHLTLKEFATLENVDGIEWIAKDVTVELLRTVKTEKELFHMREAARLTDLVMSQVPEIAHPGQTERELAWVLEKQLRDAGANGVAFSIVVASGPNAAFPHHEPGKRPLQAGDSIIVDMGALVCGYRSDLSRSFYLGNEPDEFYWEIYNLVLEAQTAALEILRPGLTGKDVDQAARDIIATNGRGDQFGHGLGHGVGLDIHEQPRLSERASEEPLSAGVVTTVEPGVYVPGWGGVRIEDLVLLVDDGIEQLSHCPKEPVIPVL